MNRAVARAGLSALVRHLRAQGPVLVAFSGGVDSSLLLAAARQALDDRVLAATSISAVHPAWERDRACSIARQLGVRHELFDSRELEMAAFTANGPERCYHCKRGLFAQLQALALREGLGYVADGANLDDRRDYRPGLRAAEEMGVQSPLMILGFNKDDIRSMAVVAGLSNWNQPAMACLATRIAYGEPVTAEKLAMVEAAEKCLMELGIGQARVRCHGMVARIEVPETDLPQLMLEANRHVIAARLRSAGFTHVALDLEGYRPGKMNRDLPAGSRLP